MPTQKKFSGSSPSLMTCKGRNRAECGLSGHCHPGKVALSPTHLFAVGVIKHVVHDVLGQLGLVRVSCPAHPGVDNALVVRALKGHLGECRVRAAQGGRRAPRQP